jgi:hypothetical protein
MKHGQLYFGWTKQEQESLAYRTRKGELRRLAPKVYVDADLGDPDSAIRSQLLPLLEFLYPAHVLAFRNALSLQPDRDHIYLISSIKSARKQVLGSLTIHILPGNTNTGIEPCLPGLQRMTEARVLLESEAGQKNRRGREKFLREEEIEAVLLKRLRLAKEHGLNNLRDEARSYAASFGMEQAYARLSEKISALLATGPASDILRSAEGFAHAACEPIDGACLERCEQFADYLTTQTFNPLPFIYEQSAWRNISFFESYFSNYIEGTEMTIHEAEQVVFDHIDISLRTADSHDVRGCYDICSDFEEMSFVPSNPKSFLDTLKNRHKILLHGRPEIHPGVFKHRNNQAGGTLFVEPDCVEGTLVRGFEIYKSLEGAFPRALFMHFLVTDVHPMQDGNGRLARIMMNAELAADNQQKILILNVVRDDYLNGQRHATHRSNFRTITKVMYQLHHYCHSLPATLYDALLEQLERDGAFRFPDDGITTFNAVRRQYRFLDV